VPSVIDSWVKSKPGKSASSSSVLDAWVGDKKKSGNALDAWVGKEPTPAEDLASQVDPNGNPIAHHIWETAKGAGRTLIDFISRPNYAAAGAAEELFSPQGGGLGAVPGRVASEIFSGIGSIQGQKEGFGQVMEQAGVGELGKLSDVLPFLFNDTGEGMALQRGGALDPTGRGTIGLAGDIFLDPTTYITAGGKTASRFLTSKGLKYLSPEGRKLAREIGKGFEADLKVAGGITDDVARVKLTQEIDKAYRAKVLTAIESNPALLDKTGIKWFGAEVVSSESLKGLTDTAKKVVLSVPGGALAARAAEAMGRGIQRVFDPYADMMGLPTEMRDAFKGLLRENRSAAAMHKTNLLERWHGIEPEWAAAARKYGKGETGTQKLGKMFADWREKTGAVTLTPEEEGVFNQIAKMYDEMEMVGVREGVIDPEQAAKFAGKYLHHEYKNPEVLSETVKASGRPVDQVITTEKFQRKREFDTLAEAVDTSRRLREEGMTRRLAGAKEKVYGELVPEYDAMKNLGSYIQQHTDSIWSKRTYEEAASRFGLQLDQVFDPGLTRALDQVRQVRPDVRAAIDATAKGIEETQFRDLSLAQKLLPKLSDMERKELAREVMSRAKSHSQVLKVEDAFGKDLLPELRVIKDGQIDPYYTKINQPGQMRTVGGTPTSMWGDKAIQLPEQIIKMVEGAPRDFLMDAAKRQHLQGFLELWDWYNNAFKAITYPFYPSGAVRDTYNNVMQAFLGVGVGAFARPFQAGRVLRGAADDVIRLGEREFTAKELKTLAKDLGVIDPSGMAYVQFTGERGAERAGLLSKARAKRGSVDNLTRSQLFINNIAAGMTPQDAAQVVKDFLFDYGELSAFDRDVMRRAMPFYVFPRKAIETYGKAVVKTPGRVVNLAKPFRGREDENNMMTSWEGEGFKLRLDRDGKTLTMLNGVDLPVRTMDMLWAGSPTKTMNRWLSMASPAIKVPYEFLSGQDPFRGQPLGRQQTYFLGPLLKEMPKVAQDFAGFHEDKDAAGRPKYTVRMDRVQVLAEAALISRVLSMGERNVKEQAKDPDWTARMLDFLTGLRLKDINFDEQQKMKVEATIRMLQEEKVKQGELRQGTYTFKPKPR
jgi:hypothetical protein